MGHPGLGRQEVLEGSTSKMQRLHRRTKEAPESQGEGKDETANLPTWAMCARAEQGGAERKARLQRIRRQGATGQRPTSSGLVETGRRASNAERVWHRVLDACGAHRS